MEGLAKRVVGFFFIFFALVLTAGTALFDYWPYGLCDILNPVGWAVVICWVVGYSLIREDVSQNEFLFVLIGTWVLFFSFAFFKAWRILIAVMVLLTMIFGLMAFFPEVLNLLGEKR